MSRRESNVELNVDVKYSSGDCKKINTKIQEENNNEIDELSKEFTEMGCIVDAMKRPPNICVETCVYDSDSDEKTEGYPGENNDDAYSDEFEDDKSEGESIKTRSQSKSAISDSKGDVHPFRHQPLVQLTKSQSTVSCKKVNSISGKSTNYGSMSIPQTRRINMSFSNERLREIERHNRILLTKILSARNSSKSSIAVRDQPIRKPVPAAAVHRRNKQKQIDHDNMILLKKIQRAKSSAYSVRR